jgi:hypothetical protein
MLSTTTIILGVLAILSALLSLYLSILEGRDKRKKIMGFGIKQIKQVAAYFSFLLTILTLIVQDKHESDNKLTELKKDHVTDSAQHVRDSTQRNNLDTTLHRIDITIGKQAATLDSASNILKRQRTQLALQQSALYKQQQSLDSNTKIISRENAIFFGVNNSISLNQRTLDSVLKVYEQEKRNDNNLQQLTNGINFGVSATIRFYTDEENKLWKPGNVPEGLIYHLMDNLDPFFESHIKPLGKNDLSDLRVFFNQFSPSFFERQFSLAYQLQGKSGTITFDKIPATDPSNFNAMQMAFDLGYTPKQHEFNVQGGFNSGLIALNEGHIENFNALVGHSNAYIIIKYRGRQHFELEGYNGKQSIKITRFEVDLTNLVYGNLGQNQIRLNSVNCHKINDKKEISRLVGNNITDDELWRYQVFQVEINP